jgi:DNA-binding NarL/FixJ family response regulator
MVLSAAGHQVETPSDPIRWASRRQSSLVLLTLTGDTDWRLLARLHDANDTLPVIALIDAISTEQGVRAVRAGARSVLSRSIAGDVLHRTVTATMDGQAVLPAEVARWLAINASPVSSQVTPPDRISWLRQLASGVTVAQLADRVGYSERAMFRLLTALYSDIGARNRLEAILLARDKGWI